MINNFDFNNFIKSEVQRQVDERVKELQPKVIIKEKETIKENLEDSLKCYSPEEVARKFLHIEVASVRKLIRVGELNAIKFNNKGLKVSAGEIQLFLNENVGRDFTELLKG